MSSNIFPPFLFLNLKYFFSIRPILSDITTDFCWDCEMEVGLNEKSQSGRTGFSFLTPNKH